MLNYSDGQVFISVRGPARAMATNTRMVNMDPETVYLWHSEELPTA